MQSEKDRKEKEQRELERREKERRDREDRQNVEKQRRDAEARERELAAEREAERQRKQMEDDLRAKEKERIDRETRMAELAVMEQETKALRLRTELLEREAIDKEKVRAEQDAARAIAEKAEVERALARAAQEAAEAASRAANDAAREAARLAAEAREAERVIFEQKIAELHEKQRLYDEQRQADGLAALLTKGATFALIAHSIVQQSSGSVPSTPRAGASSTNSGGETITLFQATADRPKPNLLVTLSEAGLLLWAHKDEVNRVGSSIYSCLSNTSC
jgi:dTMP kinase